MVSLQQTFIAVDKQRLLLLLFGNQHGQGMIGFLRFHQFWPPRVCQSPLLMAAAEEMPIQEAPIQ
jgi:hypothetical protein